MTQDFFNTLDRVLHYVWLALAVTAIIGAIGWGAWHQLFTAALALIMFVATTPEKKVHVPDDTYTAINRQIEEAVSTLSDDVRKTITIEEEVADDTYITLVAQLDTTVSTTRFRDDAWGASQIFTETNVCCNVEVLSFDVCDSTGKRYQSDFDEEMIDNTYENTSWS